MLVQGGKKFSPSGQTLDVLSLNPTYFSSSRGQEQIKEEKRKKGRRGARKEKEEPTIKTSPPENS